MPKLGMREIRRAQLIDATLLTIDQAGLGGATLASVAQRASISTGIVSHYFGDKDGLLEATMRHVLRDLWNATSRRRRAAKTGPAFANCARWSRRTSTPGRSAVP